MATASNERSMPLCQLRQSGGELVKLTVAFILNLLNKFFPNWPNRTVTIPTIAELQYFGPVGLPGVDPKVEESHVGQIRGQKNEARVLKIVEDTSRKNNQKMTLFHGMKITSHRIADLRHVFQLDLVWEGVMEVDIVALNKKSLFLIEVKSHPREFKKAFSQLNKAEVFFRNLLKSLGFNKWAQIIKVFAAPRSLDQCNRAEAERNNVCCFNIDADHFDLQKHL